jgi:hypothetical protein
MIALYTVLYSTVRNGTYRTLHTAVRTVQYNAVTPNPHMMKNEVGRRRPHSGRCNGREKHAQIGTHAPAKLARKGKKARPFGRI